MIRIIAPGGGALAEISETPAGYRVRWFRLALVAGRNTPILCRTTLDDRPLHLVRDAVAAELARRL